MVIIIILSRVNQRQPIQQYLYSSSMKTSEIKSFAVHLTRPAKPALFKTQLNQIFAPEDAPTILAVHGALREARDLGRGIPESILGLNYELIGRLRQYIEESRPDSHKLREVKSAKKLKPATPLACDGFSEFEEHRPIRLKPLKLMSENKQPITNKENTTIFTQLRPLGWTEKPKLRKLPEIKSQVPKAKKEDGQQRGEDVDKQLETLKQMEAKASEENRKLRSMLNQMQGRGEPCELDVKVWLHFQEATQPQEQGMHLGIRIPGSPGQEGKGSKESGDLVAHLQMILVSQHKQIEALQQKLVESSKGTIGVSKGKPERWNNY